MKTRKKVYILSKILIRLTAFILVEGMTIQLMYVAYTKLFL